MWNVWGKELLTEFWWGNLRRKTLSRLGRIGQDNMKIQL
jgi:hypothetical protein